MLSWGRVRAALLPQHAASRFNGSLGVQRATERRERDAGGRLRRNAGGDILQLPEPPAARDDRQLHVGVRGGVAVQQE